MAKPILIVMLTHNDQTVKNAAEVFEAAKDAPAEFWGMKDEGIPEEEMVKLFKRMKECGKTTFLEIVADNQEVENASVELAIRVGTDIVTGTHFRPELKDMLDKAGIKYMPFIGKTVGIPIVIKGTVEEIVGEAVDLIEKGCDGIDAAPYRYDGDIDRYNRELLKNVKAPCIVAGSVNGFERVQEVIDYGYWGFTVGSAFFENKFGDGSFADQITSVVEYIDKHAK